MAICLVTGSGGLIGGETARFFAAKGFDVVGVDNDMRSYFFGKQASTQWHVDCLVRDLSSYSHCVDDIRDQEAMERLFNRYGKEIAIVVHTAAQPSHDWAALEPITDFDINARATLILLEATRKHCPETAFIFISTNKVYGDTPNLLPLVELDTRYELAETHQWHAKGVDETMSLDTSTHSVFGASKVAADVMVQEYGRYFGMNTVCFRGGCLTGPGHSGAELHGFLSYLVYCAVTGRQYTIYGYKGKQVRDNIHSSDLVRMFWCYYKNPRPGEVYNAGGGRHSNCSVLEAIAQCEKTTGHAMNWCFGKNNRVGDHIWWISDVSKFKKHYPEWDYTYGIEDIISEMYANRHRYEKA